MTNKKNYLFPLSSKIRNPKLPFIKKKAHNELMKKKTEFKKMRRNIFLSIFFDSVSSDSHYCYSNINKHIYPLSEQFQILFCQ